MKRADEATSVAAGFQATRKSERRQPSRFVTGEYRGYMVRVRLERANEDCEPFRIDGPESVYELMKELQFSDRERFYTLHVNARLDVVGCEETSVGTISQSMVALREVYKAAILSSAAGIIVAHNHPSGDPTPSVQDADVLQQLYEAGELMGIPLHDSIVIGRNSYYSFKEKGSWPPRVKRPWRVGGL